MIKGRISNPNYINKLQSYKRGSIAEHLIVADLIGHNWEVYKSVTHQGSVDLIIKKEIKF